MIPPAISAVYCTFASEWALQEGEKPSALDLRIHSASSIQAGSRAVSAVVISPALQRGVNEANSSLKDGAHCRPARDEPASETDPGDAARSRLRCWPRALASHREWRNPWLTMSSTSS